MRNGLLSPPLLGHRAIETPQGSCSCLALVGEKLSPSARANERRVLHSTSTAALVAVSPPHCPGNRGAVWCSNRWRAGNLPQRRPFLDVSKDALTFRGTVCACHLGSFPLFARSSLDAPRPALWSGLSSARPTR